MRYGMLIDLKRCVGCGGCVIACKRVNGTLGDVYWCNVTTKEIGTYPNAYQVTIPHACMQCETPECIEVCPTDATKKDPETGIVNVDYDLCIGDGSCVAACPYDARTINPYNPVANPYWGEGAEQMPFEALTTAWHQKGKVEKCCFCQDRLAVGEPPACVRTCVASARIFGDLDDPESELVRAIEERGAAPMNPELGTKPQVYYVPKR